MASAREETSLWRRRSCACATSSSLVRSSGCKVNGFKGRPVRIPHLGRVHDLLHELFAHHTSPCEGENSVVGHARQDRGFSFPPAHAGHKFGSLWRQPASGDGVDATQRPAADEQDVHRCLAVADARGRGEASSVHERMQWNRAHKIQARRVIQCRKLSRMTRERNLKKPLAIKGILTVWRCVSRRVAKTSWRCATPPLVEKSSSGGVVPRLGLEPRTN